MPLKHSDIFYDPTAITDRGINPYLAQVRELSLPHAPEKSAIMFGEQLRGMIGQWRREFSADVVNESRPLVVEIGCYKGSTLIHFAKLNPSFNWIGIDITFKRVALSAKRVIENALQNARVVMGKMSGKSLKEMFGPSEIDLVMVFFPDPWTKKSQRKNRMFTVEFAHELRSILKADGRLWFKSDQLDYFEEVKEFCMVAGLEYCGEAPTDIEGTDHATPFETRFKQMGLPTYSGVWKRQDQKLGNTAH
jgi:tRNA (guanine-N7-)-methyltransferase